MQAAVGKPDQELVALRDALHRPEHGLVGALDDGVAAVQGGLGGQRDQPGTGVGELVGGPVQGAGQGAPGPVP